MIARAARPLALLGGQPMFRDPVYVTRARRPANATFENLAADVLRSRWFTNDGALVQGFQEQVARRLGVGSCAVFCNGTIALQVALRSLECTGEVITTPFTFPATVHAIEWIGLTPVFCDIDPETYNLDGARAVDLVSSRTSAVVPVHVFGNPCDTVGIERLAETRGLKVVYDAAHAFGVSFGGRPIGTWGDLSVFSFHATKLFHTGEGGAVVSRDGQHFRKLALLRNFGIVNEDEVSGAGVNGKLSELHAALGLAMLDDVDDEIAARERLLARYRERLSGVDGVLFQRIAPETVPNHSYCTIQIDEAAFGLSRDAVHEALRAERIITRKYFSPLCSDMEHYRHLPSAQPAQLPNARRLAARILCLPLYGDLSVDDVDKIADCVLAIRAAALEVRRVTEGLRR